MLLEVTPASATVAAASSSQPLLLLLPGIPFELFFVIAVSEGKTVQFGGGSQSRGEFFIFIFITDFEQQIIQNLNLLPPPPSSGP